MIFPMALMIPYSWHDLAMQLARCLLALAKYPYLHFRPRLFAIVITESGDAAENPLGIITTRDPLVEE